MMSNAQFWVMFASVATLITGAVGWMVAWIKGVSNRVSELEIEVAVLKALEERNK